MRGSTMLIRTEKGQLEHPGVRTYFSHMCVFDEGCVLIN